MMRALVFFMAISVCFSSNARAQTDSSETDAAIAKPVETAPAAAAKAAKTFQLSKVLLDTKTKQVQGKIKGGTMCVFPSKIDIAGTTTTEDYERYDNLFSEKMKERNFAIITTSQELFAGATGDDKSDFLIGATLRPDTLNVCSSVSGVKGTLLLDVEWQIFDQAKRQVVETITTTAQSEIPKFDVNGYTELWNRAFLVNLDALIEQGIIAKYSGAIPTNAVAQPEVPASGE